MIDLQNSPIISRYQHLHKTIGSERFLKMQGLGNEVPFFICPFNPQDTNEMMVLYDQLINQLHNQGIKILSIDLFDLSIEILKGVNKWQQIMDSEQSLAKDELKELLQNLLDPENHLVPAIAEKMSNEEFDVLFIKGVGEVFPYIRSHTVLNNLQSTAKFKPTVMFFPGEYKHTPEGGMTLDLFGRLRDDKYYRAFNIYQYQI